MFYIKLEDDMSLVVTVRESIHRGDNLNQKIRYLLPMTVGEIDMLTACVYLNYIRADGTPDIVQLERLEDTYNESYFQYVFPITCKLTKCAGEACTWLNIFAGTASNPTIAKSGECVLRIEDSKNMDDYFCDHQITALYALQKQAEVADASTQEIKAEVEKKGDNLVYDAEKKILQMSSDGKPVGDAIDMSEMVNEDETIHFGEEDDAPTADADAVIYCG